MAKKSKQDLKVAAKQSAKTGSLSQTQVRQLKDVGVKPANIQKIKSANTTARDSASNQTTSGQTQANQPKPLTGNAVKDGRYGMGAQQAALDNYNSLVEQGVTDAFNPGKPGSRKNSMADGFFGKKELKAFADLKGIDASKARARLSNKGASFTGGANKLADSVYAKNNPFLTMMIGSGTNSDLYTAGLGKGQRRQLQNYRDSSANDYSNKLLSGEVFEFRKKYGMVGDKPNPNIDRLNQIFGNPTAATPTTNPTTNPTPDDTTKPDDTEITPPEELPQEPTNTAGGVGQMSGGGMGAMGASKLNRARSRLQRLGILGRGTGLLGRGLQYGNTLNA